MCGITLGYSVEKKNQEELGKRVSLQVKVCFWEILACNAYVTSICFGSLNTWTLYGTLQVAGLYFKV